jgi:hypothetical protein
MSILTTTVSPIVGPMICSIKKYTTKTLFFLFSSKKFPNIHFYIVPNFTAFSQSLTESGKIWNYIKVYRYLETFSNFNIIRNDREDEYTIPSERRLMILMQTGWRCYQAWMLVEYSLWQLCCQLSA